MARLGSDKNPIIVNVHRDEEAARVMGICEMKDWSVIVGMNLDEPEDISDLIQKLEPDTVVYDAPKIGRNDYCPCGSGKKFKKCCAQ